MVIWGVSVELHEEIEMKTRHVFAVALAFVMVTRASTVGPGGAGPPH
jgi:hypothetical protein